MTISALPVEPKEESLPMQFRLQAYSGPQSFDLRKCMALFSSYAVERFSSDCMIVDLGKYKKLFLFRFGTVVFLDVPQDEQIPFLVKLEVTSANTALSPDNEEVSEDEFILSINSDKTSVAFNSVTLPAFEIDRIQLVALHLARSNALDLIEYDVDEFLKRSEKMTSSLKKGTWISKGRDKLLQFLGEGLSARHRIVNQLAVFDNPEKIWDSEVLYTLYYQLYNHFDIEERIEDIERKLNLCSEVSQLLLEISNARRSEILEIIIILLITLELAKSFMGYF